MLGAGMGAVRAVLLSHPSVVLVAARWGALGGCGAAQEAGSPHTSGSAEGAQGGCWCISLLPGITSCPPHRPYTSPTHAVRASSHLSPSPGCANPPLTLMPVGLLELRASCPDPSGVPGGRDPPPELQACRHQRHTAALGGTSGCAPSRHLPNHSVQTWGEPSPAAPPEHRAQK